MAIVAYTLLLLFCILCWILIAPVKLIIDTTHSIYRLKLFYLMTIDFGFFLDKINLDLRSRIFSKRIEIDYWKSYRKRKQNRIHKTRNEPGSNTRKIISFRKFRKLISSFKVEKFSWKLDTGDYYYNGLLYPLAFASGYGQKKVEVNFRGENELELVVENRLFRVIRAII